MSILMVPFWIGTSSGEVKWCEIWGYPVDHSEVSIEIQGGIELSASIELAKRWIILVQTGWEKVVI